MLALTIAKSQDTSKVNAIDKLIQSRKKLVTLILTESYMESTPGMHSTTLDTITMEYKFTANKSIESIIKKTYSGKEYYADAFYYEKGRLIKALTIYGSWVQFAYYEGDDSFYSGASDGKPNPNIKSNLARSKSLLKNIKKKLKTTTYKVN
jgi:hypothetical protein